MELEQPPLKHNTRSLRNEILKGASYLAISIETTTNGCCTISIKGFKQQQQFIKLLKPQPIIGVTLMKLLSAITLEKELHWHCERHATCCNLMLQLAIILKINAILELLKAVTCYMLQPT